MDRGERLSDKSFEQIIKFLELSEEDGGKRDIELFYKVKSLGLKLNSLKGFGLINWVSNFSTVLKYKSSDLDFGPVDRFIRFFRKRAARKVIGVGENITVVDVGCGRQASLGWDLRRKIKKYIGVDRDIPEMVIENLEFKQAVAEDMNELLEEGAADFVVGLAVIEHVQDPTIFLDNCKKLLKQEGEIVLTTPQPVGAPLLDFLAKVHLINDDEIDEHKTYFDHVVLSDLLLKTGFVNITAKRFLFGVNGLYTARKP